MAENKDPFSDEAQKHVDKVGKALKKGDHRTALDEALAAYDAGSPEDKARITDNMREAAKRLNRITNKEQTPKPEKK
ncbi:hypothetical protein [Sphaerisporangium sp. NPDC051011]|uniref:hypothetical protein n=1 Tax=Sphaerisporangium sp. NPDC051011 TaxID=3155792 RepID=UPI0033E1A64B